MPPTSRVLATCVPPSAWRSSPTISIVRIVLDPLGEQVDLGPDQVRDGERLGPWQDRHPDVARGRQLGVDRRLDGVDEVARHPLELEVHATRSRLHVAAGHLRAVVAPDHAAQGVERGVGAHQRMPARPVEVDLDEVADRRRVAAIGLELVGDLATGLARAADGPRPAVAGPDDEAAIRGLAAAARVEDRAIEHHGGRVARLDGRDPRLGGAGVGVGVGELLARRGHRGASRSLDGERPDHRGMDGADEGVGPGVEGGDVVDPRRDAGEDLALEQLGAVHVAQVERDVVRRARVLVLELDLERRVGRRRRRLLLELDVERADLDQVRVARAGRAAGLGGAAARRRGDSTAPGDRSSPRWRRRSRPRSRRTAGRASGSARNAWSRDLS